MQERITKSQPQSPTHTPTPPDPFFLIGSERSGTTLLRLMIDSHPNIACNLESEYLVSQITHPTQFPPIKKYRDWLSRDRVFQHSNFTINPNLDYLDLVNDFIRQKKERDNASIVGATVHYNFIRLPRIWPNAKYIYLLRDGRDVSRSVMRMGWAGNLYTAADVWLKAEHEWEQMRPTLNANQYIELRYEELILHPERELTRICDFLGYSFTQKMFDYTKSTNYKMPDPQLVYQWKRKISKSDLQQVESRIADQLLKRDYELSGLERVTFNEKQDRKLRFESRKKVFNHRHEQFGIWLALQDTISRKLGLNAWQAKCKAKINKIINENLR